ncbi:MAG: helix-turn-helix domain-containing protein [Chloroflexi bacterium]|nr:helix-turn-helix domain-containing protein [Chloroflexota bacterium]
MSEIAGARFGQKFDELRAKYANTPDEIEHYEKTVRTVMLIRRFLMVIDAERKRAGVSKAELARRIGADASVIRRLFSSKSSNPTLRTVLDVLSILNIDIELRPKRARQARTRSSTKATRTKPHRRTSVKSSA